jgi:rod shape-determining protein MreC
MKRQLIILGLIVLVFVCLSFFQAGLKNFFYSFSMPGQNIFSYVGKNLSTAFDVFLKAGIRQKENQALEKENQALKGRLDYLRELEKENNFLRGALSLGLEKEFKLLLSEITFYNSNEDLLVINKGKDDGVTKDMAVITAERVLIGKTGEVYNGFSQVILTTNQESDFPVKVAEKDFFAKAKGEGEGRLLLDFIPRDKKVESGNLIFSAGLDGVFPKGLLVGEVKTVQKSDLDTYKKAEIKPAFNISDLSVVFIILDY